MRKENCIFCKIANGEIPSKTIYEDNEFRVIMDVAPATKGHALILVKEHADNLYQLPEELAGKAMILARKMVMHMTAKLNCEGFNILQNNGEVAGQTVSHFHLHLIPRYKEDGQSLKFDYNIKVAEDIEVVWEQVKYTQ